MDIKDDDRRCYIQRTAYCISVCQGGRKTHQLLWGRLCCIYLPKYPSLSLSFYILLQCLSAGALLSFCFGCVLERWASISIRQIPPPPAKKNLGQPDNALLMSATTKKGLSIRERQLKRERERGKKREMV